MPDQQEPTDHQRWLAEQQRTLAERAHDRTLEFFDGVNKAAMDTANLALRMSLLINGGAAVALLSFVGGLPTGQKKAVADTLLWFASGVAAAVTAMVLAYFTHYCMAGSEGSKIRKYEAPYIEAGPHTAVWRRCNYALHILSVIVGVGSIVLFVIGMVYVRSALTRLT
jgi:hypothetical protein